MSGCFQFWAAIERNSKKRYLKTWPQLWGLRSDEWILVIVVWRSLLFLILSWECQRISYHENFRQSSLKGNNCDKKQSWRHSPVCIPARHSIPKWMILSMLNVYVLGLAQERFVKLLIGNNWRECRGHWKAYHWNELKHHVVNTMWKCEHWTMCKMSM